MGKRRTFYVEFDGRFCFVEATDPAMAEREAQEEFGKIRGPYRAREAGKAELEQFIAQNGVVLP